MPHACEGLVATEQNDPHQIFAQVSNSTISDENTATRETLPTTDDDDINHFNHSHHTHLYKDFIDAEDDTLA